MYIIDKDINTHTWIHSCIFIYLSIINVWYIHTCISINTNVTMYTYTHTYAYIYIYIYRGHRSGRAGNQQPARIIMDPLTSGGTHNLLHIGLVINREAQDNNCSSFLVYYWEKLYIDSHRMSTLLSSKFSENINIVMNFNVLEQWQSNKN